MKVWCSQIIDVVEEEVMDGGASELRRGCLACRMPGKELKDGEGLAVYDGGKRHVCRL